MSDLLEQVDRIISSRALVRRGEAVLVAVSGGIDSMVLLQILQQLAKRNSWRLTVAHLNHQLRGRSSDADERLVLATARKLKLKAISAHADVKALAKEQKLSLEMAARKARHAFLARTAKRLGIGTIALAHHADDQLELFFLRLLRGSGSEGLSGMKWRSRSPHDSKVWLIRPFLNQPKAELLKYAAENRVQFREDASNVSVDFQRNRLRHELLPLLRKKYQPALDRVIGRVIEIASGESDFLDQAAKAWLTKPGTPFDKLHPALQRRCLQVQLQKLDVAVDFELIEALRTKPAQSMSVDAKRGVVRDERGHLHLRPNPESPQNGQGREVALLDEKAGRICFAGLQVDWRITKLSSRSLPTAIPGREIFDADKVGDSIVLRHWQPGDRFQPIGLPKSVKVQDLFTNQKIPRAQRHRLMVATTAAGELFWVEKLRISERFKLSPQTIRRLIWTWKPH